MANMRSGGRGLSASLAMAAALLVGAASRILGVCGPFTDVSDATFCPFVLEVFTMGITTGTTATTYDPASPVSRLQMAAFLSRTVDRTLQRSSRRLAMEHFWTPQDPGVLALTTVGDQPQIVKFDGADLWVGNNTGSGGGTVSRVRASDGKLLETWTGAGSATGLLVAIGRVFVCGVHNLYRIDPREPAGVVTTVATNIGGNGQTMAFDGSRIFVAGISPGSISIITPSGGVPLSVTTVTTGFSTPVGALYDGANVWVTDNSAGTLLKLSSTAAILQTVTVGSGPVLPAFDGTNIWVPNTSSASVTVVRAATGAVLATLTGNGLSSAFCAATDGQRVLVTNNTANNVSVFKAADLTPLGFFTMGPGTTPFTACSDGSNFWITFFDGDKLARF